MKQAEIKSGHIEIEDNKVIFVYHELEKPTGNFYNDNWIFDNKELARIIVKQFSKEVKEYEASKQEAEVGNDFLTLKILPSILWLRSKSGKCRPDFFKQNQPCEAEIENGIALITKIT